MQRSQASLLPTPHPWGGGAWPHAEPHLPTPTPQVHRGALFSPGSWEALSAGTELHTQTSIGCSSAPSASAKDGGLDRVSPAPPSRRPLPGAQQSQGRGRRAETRHRTRAPRSRASYGQRGGRGDVAWQTYPHSRYPGREAGPELAGTGDLTRGPAQKPLPSHPAPTSKPSPFWFLGSSVSVGDMPTGSNMKAPLGWAVHVFILKSFRLARTSP